MRGVRIDVEEGSKPAVAGVSSALRFWVMLSSIAPRERRRKSRNLGKLSIFIVDSRRVDLSMPRWRNKSEG